MVPIYSAAIQAADAGAFCAPHVSDLGPDGPCRRAVYLRRKTGLRFSLNPALPPRLPSRNRSSADPVRIQSPFRVASRPRPSDSPWPSRCRDTMTLRWPVPAPSAPLAGPLHSPAPMRDPFCADEIPVRSMRAAFEALIECVRCAAMPPPPIQPSLISGAANCEFRNDANVARHRSFQAAAAAARQGDGFVPCNGRGATQQNPADLPRLASPHREAKPNACLQSGTYRRWGRYSSLRFCKHLGREDCVEGLQAAGIERLLADTETPQTVANARVHDESAFPGTTLDFPVAIVFDGAILILHFFEVPLEGSQ